MTLVGKCGHLAHNRWLLFDNCYFCKKNLHVFFYKQHFYEQHQAEIGKKIKLS